jgi:hypothetical protein
MHQQEGVTPASSDTTDTHSLKEMSEMLRYLVQNCVTKSDLTLILAELKYELKDHTTRECGKLRGDLLEIAHRQDEKTNELVRVIEKSGSIPKKEAIRVIEINPFLRSV